MDDKQMIIDSTGEVVEDLDLSPEAVIQVVQLPLIAERMAEINEQVMQSVSGVLAMECTEETYKTVKAARASLKKDFDAWETRRKEIKALITAPYDEFNRAYEANIGQPYKTADAQLKKRIDEIETGIKSEKAAKVEKYFYELRTQMGIPETLVNFGQLGIRIGMADSVKKLQDRVAEELGKIAADLDTIRKHPDAADIMVEYKRDRNFSRSLASVMDRKREKEAAQRRLMQEAASDAERQKKAMDAQMAAQNGKPAEPVQAPVSVPVSVPVQVPVEAPAPAQPQKKVGLPFRVSGPHDKMLVFRDMIKSYCEENGLEILGLKKVRHADIKEDETYYV